jgi:hypothetical protein
MNALHKHKLQLSGRDIGDVLSMSQQRNLKLVVPEGISNPLSIVKTVSVC